MQESFIDHFLRLFENGQRGLKTFLLKKENNVFEAEWRDFLRRIKFVFGCLTKVGGWLIYFL